MPKVNNLATGKTVHVKVTPAKAVPAKPIKVPAPAPAQAESLMESKDASRQLAKTAERVNLPAWLQNTPMPETTASDFGGYVGFASSASGKWAEQQAARLQDGTPYLYHQQRYIPCDPLEFFLLAGECFQTLMVGKEGKFQWASRDMNEEGPTAGSNRTEPHYVCSMIVRAEGRLIPIKGDFKGTKSGGVEGAIRAVEAAGTPEWLKLSDAHRITAAFPQAFGRVFHKCTTKMMVSKTSGNAYYRASVVSNPATLTQMQELIDALTDDDFRAGLDECHKNYLARIAFIDAVIARS